MDKNKPSSHQVYNGQSPEQKKLKIQDLRATLSATQHGDNRDSGDNFVAFHEKVDNIYEEQEELRNKHLEYLKQAAQLLTEEGELISSLQGIDSEDVDIDNDVSRMEEIVEKNLRIYTDMRT